MTMTTTKKKTVSQKEELVLSGPPLFFELLLLWPSFDHGGPNVQRYVRRLPPPAAHLSMAVCAADNGRRPRQPRGWGCPGATTGQPCLLVCGLVGRVYPAGACGAAQPAAPWRCWALRKAILAWVPVGWLRVPLEALYVAWRHPLRHAEADADDDDDDDPFVLSFFSSFSSFPSSFSFFFFLLFPFFFSFFFFHLSAFEPQAFRKAYCKTCFQHKDDHGKSGGGGSSDDGGDAGDVAAKRAAAEAEREAERQREVEERERVRRMAEEKAAREREERRARMQAKGGSNASVASSPGSPRKDVIHVVGTTALTAVSEDAKSIGKEAEASHRI